MNNSLNPETTGSFTPQTGPVRFGFLRGIFRFLAGLVLCLVTLIALIYALENWRGKRAWEKHRKELEAKGEVIDIQQLKPPPVPEDQNFAMTPFLAPLFDFKPGTQSYRDTNALARIQSAFVKLPSAPRDAGDWQKGQKLDLAAWVAAFNEQAARVAEKQSDRTNTASSLGTTDPASALLELLKEYDPILNELRTASRRPYARFNIRYDEPNPAGILLPHLAKLKSLTQILSLKATAELRLNQTEAALEDINLAFYLVDTIRNEPILISQLVRCVNFQLSLQPLWEGLVDHRWSETQLHVLEKKLQQFDFLAGGVLAMRGERALGNSVISFVQNNRAMLPELVDILPERDRNVSSSIARLMPRGWFYMEQLNYDRLFEKHVFSGVDVNTRRVDPKLIEANAQLLESELRAGLASVIRHRTFARILLPAVTRAHRKFAYMQTMADCALIACALERYRTANGELPESHLALVPKFLDQLPRDLVSGEPLKYRRLDANRYILYSVGWNQTDDGGRLELTGKVQGRGTLDLVQGDWVWQCP